MKRIHRAARAHSAGSRPARARGLKLAVCVCRVVVAPVAPRAGAWIETMAVQECYQIARVAPRAGAWIETISAVIGPMGFQSRPARARGLKLRIKGAPVVEIEVAPRAGAWIETARWAVKG